MHENIETRIGELKEIAAQIYNCIADKQTGYFPYAQTKLLSFIDRQSTLETEMKYQHMTLPQGYDTWITRLLIDLQQWRGNDARQYKLLLREYQAYFQGKVNTGKLSEKVNPMWQAIRGIGD